MTLETMTHDRLCRRAADRDEAARLLIAAAAALGVTVTENAVNRLDPRTRHVTLAFGEYRVSMSFDGGLKFDVFLAHWHTATRSQAVYPPDFPAESINRYHWGKATTHAATFGELLLKIKAGFVRLSAISLDNDMA
jgi:hypothetical protein